MKKLMIIPTVMLLLNCNNNKTSENDRADAMSSGNDSSASQSLPENAATADSTSSPAKDAAYSGATSTMPKQDSTVQR